jgi:RHS repeat-associated protein
VIALTDANQQSQTQYRYQPYGVTTLAGAADVNSQQYTGRENDGTGVYYYRNRYYSPQTGRFISEDPTGWASGQTNAYAYVNGNPVQLSDPFGLQGVPFPYTPVPGAVPGGGGQDVPPGVAKPWGPRGLNDWWNNTFGPIFSRPDGAIDAIRGAKDWGRKNGVNPNEAVDRFHDIKKGNRNRPGSKAKDDCSVNPDTGEVFDGTGEHIGDLGDGH